MYKRNAVRVSDVLSVQYPDIPVHVNPVKPRSKSFEVFYKSGTDSTEIWSGVKLGPPRKLKFVEDDKLVELLEEKMD